MTRLVWFALGVATAVTLRRARLWAELVEDWSEALDEVASGLGRWTR